MYAIIVGGGRVGQSLAKSLLSAGHEVLLIDKEEAVCEAVKEELGSVCMLGDGSEVPILSEAGVERADLLVAVTGSDEDNLVACQVAKHRFRVPRCIARVNNPDNETLFKRLGIDVTVSSINLILGRIEQEIPSHLFTHLLTLDDSRLEVLEIKIPANAVAVGKMVNELLLPPGSALALLVRKEQSPRIPAPETVLEAEDVVLAVTPVDSVDALRLALTQEVDKVEEEE